MGMLARVLAYHPTVAVRKESGEVVTIEIDMDDWYENQIVWESLLRGSGGRTIGDAVVAIERGRFNLGLSGGIVRVRVRNKVSDQLPTMSAGWLDSEFNSMV